MTQKINAPHRDSDHADQKDGRPSAHPVETEWQAFFRQLADNLEPEERKALPAHIQE